MRPLIGITGGIGSGKSTVAGMFNVLGIPLFDADNAAKRIMAEDTSVKNALIDLFGNEAYDATGVLNRSQIASLVFNDRSLLNKMNSIVHPKVFLALQQWMSEPAQSNAPYLIQESAIVFEENLNSRFQKVILVVAPEELRIERVVERDNTTREKVEARIRNQWPDDRKIPLCDFVIYNDGIRSLISQVRDIDAMLKLQ